MAAKKPPQPKPYCERQPLSDALRIRLAALVGMGGGVATFMLDLDAETLARAIAGHDLNYPTRRFLAERAAILPALPVCTCGRDPNHEEKQAPGVSDALLSGPVRKP